MNWKISSVFLSILLAGCQQNNPGKEAKSDITQYQTPYLIEVDELSAKMEEENIKIIDFRKNDAYLQGHIKGALQMWRSDIEDTTYTYGGMIAKPFQIETLFTNLGIRNQDTLVIYDNNGLCDAARLWWVLQAYDFTKVQMLNGGYSEWLDQGGSVSKKSPKVVSSSFKLTDSPSMKYYISRDELLELNEREYTIIDTRSEQEFLGNVRKKGAAKAGRITNSVNQDWAESIDHSQNKKFKSFEELAELYDQLKIGKEDLVLTYCHSGVRSAHTTFVMTQLLGYKNVKNYDGSWTEWSHFEEPNVHNDTLKIVRN